MPCVQFVIGILLISALQKAPVDLLSPCKKREKLLSIKALPAKSPSFFWVLFFLSTYSWNSKILVPTCINWPLTRQFHRPQLLLWWLHIIQSIFYWPGSKSVVACCSLRASALGCSRPPFSFCCDSLGVILVCAGFHHWSGGHWFNFCSSQFFFNPESINIQSPWSNKLLRCFHIKI